MLLTSLELQGFKSFAKRTVLTFESGITGVVGPNGSGKSNIADAIRWVLGAQSKKAVRGKVGSDVIFSGTNARAAMSLAEVSLTFDNRSKKLPYEFDEVVVTRRLYRSGDSEYLVNGSQVRLTDLQHAFAVAGIGAENYTVIGQGMVDRVLSQSAKERLGLFEEAAGVRQFKLKRDEARRKLTETTTNLSRVDDIVGELSPRLKLLRRQASALEQQAAIEQELRDAYRAKFGHRYRTVSSEFDTVKAKQTEIGKEFVQLEKELKELISQVEERRRSRQGIKLTELLGSQSKLRDQRDAINQATHRAATDQEVAAAAQERLADQDRQLVARLEMLAEPAEPGIKSDAGLTSQLKQAEADLAAIDRQYEELKKGLAPLSNSEAAGNVRSAFTKLDQAIADEQPYAELQKLAAAVQAAIATLGGEEAPDDTTAILAKRDELTKQLHDLKVQQAAADTARKLQDAEAGRIARERQAIEQQRASVQKEQGELKVRITKAQETTAGSDQQLADLEKQLADLEKQLADLEPKILLEQQSTTGESAELQEQETALKTKQATHEDYRRELADHNVTIAKLETRLDDLGHEATAKLGEAFPPKADEELPAESTGSDDTIAKLERKMLELGAIDPEVTAEHKEVEERHGFLTTQGEDLRTAKADLEKLIRQLERQSQTLFREAFTKISDEFETYFSKLFGGGKAELVLIEQEATEEMPADFGIEIKAVPPGKRLQNLSQLSGGERALTSVALLFAILTVNPSPFVMLDEVDAALDEANTARFAELLAQLGENTQFVVVTHNRDTMRAAQTLYGVTMNETGISTMLSIKLPEAEQVVGVA